MEVELDAESKNRKSPYFSLPDPALLKPFVRAITHASTIEGPKHKPNRIIYKTLKDIFGEITKMSDENQAKFLLMVLKNGNFEPDWKATAADLGTNNGHNVQRRFKSIVEKAGFKLENGKQVTGGPQTTQNATDTAGTDAVGNGAIPQTPKKPRKTTEPGSSTKRRKSNTCKVVKPKSEEEDKNASDGQDDKLE